MGAGKGTDAAGGGGGAFAPTDLSGLTLWLDATNAGTTTDGATVAPWPDRSGGGHNAAANANGGVYKANIRNSKGVIRLTAASTQGYLTSAWSVLAGAGGEVSIITALSIAVPTNGTHGYDNAGITDPGGFLGLVFKDDGAGNPNPLVYNWDGNEDFFGLTTLDANVWAQVYMRKGGGNASIRQDGGSATTSSTGDTSDLTGAVAIGRNAAAYMTVDIGDILIYNRDLTDPERVQLQDYLRTKWSLP